jgi:hypothetical protein
MAVMQTEPVAVTTGLRFLLNGAVQGLIAFEIVELSTIQHSWLTITFAGMIEIIMWFITRSEVWAGGGAPTHPPTEDLWSSKLAATKAEDAAILERTKAEYEALFTAPGHGEAAAPAGRHTDPGLSQATQEALVDSINPGPEV